MNMSSSMVPMGRDIPSLHTEDIYGARPKQNTNNRNVWQDQFVSEQIRNQPDQKQRFESMGKQIRSPMFSDFYYKKVDLNQPTKKYEPPEIYRGSNFPTTKLATMQVPQQQNNDTLQKFMIQQGEISNNVRNSKSQRIQTSVQNYEKEYGRNKSPLVMHIDPGKTMQRSQPFANFQSQQQDDSKELLKGDTSFYSPRFQQSGYGGVTGYKQRPADPNNSNYRIQSSQNLNKLINVQNNNGVQEQQNKYRQYLSQSQLGTQQKFQSPKYNQQEQGMSSQDTSIMVQNQQPNGQQQQQQSTSNQQHQQQLENNKKESRQSLNRIQVKNIINENRNDINTTNNGIQSSRNIENNNVNKNYNTVPSLTPQHRTSSSQQYFSNAANNLANRNNNMSGSYTQQLQSAKRTYKPYNVISHKRHQEYQPKFGLQSNHWDCYDKPKWQDYVAKKEAPKNIFMDKNRKNIDTADFTTSNIEYGSFRPKYKV